jgi:hypothetical protein
LNIKSFLVGALCLYTPLSFAEHVVASETYTSMALANDAMMLICGYFNRLMEA